MQINKDKTAFTLHLKIYQSIRMSFGHCNAPGTFRSTMNVVPFSVKWEFALVYFDNILIFSRTLEQHSKHVSKNLSLLDSAGATLKLKKCSFFTNFINPLGHVVRPRRMKLASHTTDALHKLKSWANGTKLSYFFDLCSVVQRFTPNFALVASPLYRRLKKDPATRSYVLIEKSWILWRLSNQSLQHHLYYCSRILEVIWW